MFPTITIPQIGSASVLDLSQLAPIARTLTGTR